jgi:Spy/CpxP family protein refolding chaperone
MLVLVFGVGGLTGMALEEGLGLDWFDFLDEDNEEVDDQILSGLQLSEEQRARIDGIREAQEERLEDYWETRIPDMRAIVGLSYEEIRAVLTPGQRETFDQRIRLQGIPVPRRPD